MNTLLRLLLIGSIVLLSNGCSDNEDDPPLTTKGNLVIRKDNSVTGTGTEHDFGSIELGENSEISYTISNDGEEDMYFRVMDWDIFSVEGYSLNIGNNQEGGTITLSAKASTQMTITFAPEVVEERTSVLILGGDDLDNWTVNFRGKGHVTVEQISPPAWIQGVWKNGETIVYVFTSDNVTNASNGVQIFDAKDFNETYAAIGMQDTKYYDVSTGDTKYELFLKQEGNIQMTCTFDKLTETTLNYKVNDSQTIMLTKE
ncbi:MAG: hypothetical protein WD578_11980 [Bacteroidales bacterium]